MLGIRPFEFISKIINLKIKQTYAYMYYITVYIILLCVFIGGDLKFNFKKCRNK